VDSPKAKSNRVWFALPIVIAMSSAFVGIGVALWFFVSRVAGYATAGLGVYMFVAYAAAMVAFGRRRGYPFDLADTLRLGGGETVLDVGCGLGRLTIDVAKRLDSGRAVGIDVWDRMEIPGNSPEKARARAEAEGVGGRVEFRDGDVLSLDFEDGSFDAVTCGSLLNHFSREKKLAGLAKIRRVLKTGGRLLLMEPVRSLITWLAFTPFGFMGLRNAKYWRWLVEESGLRVVASPAFSGFAVIVAERPDA